jgi:pimeloyl-ACP methyl ester carboxylesterase
VSQGAARRLALTSVALLAVTAGTACSTWSGFAAPHPGEQRDRPEVALGEARVKLHLARPAGDRRPRELLFHVTGDSGWPGLDPLMFDTMAVRVGCPLLLLQSTHDRHVAAAQARRLFGPDRPRRRMVAIEAEGHTFGGHRDELFRQVEAGLSWIAAGTEGTEEYPAPAGRLTPQVAPIQDPGVSRSGWSDGVACPGRGLRGTGRQTHAAS